MKPLPMVKTAAGRLAALIIFATAVGATGAAGPQKPPFPLGQLLKEQNMITTVVIDNHVTTVTRPHIVSRATSDPLGVYSGRPLMAVGDVESVNVTSQTITIRIDPALSRFPHILEAQARKKGVLDKLKAREFSPERTFFLTRSSHLFDGKRGLLGGQRGESLRDRWNRELIQLQDFHSGDRVSVYFRYNQDPSKPAAVLNVSKQDRARRDYDADFRMAPIQTRTVNANELSSLTARRDTVTSYPLPRAGNRFPRIPSGSAPFRIVR